MLGSARKTTEERERRVYTKNSDNVIDGVPRVFVYADADEDQAWTYACPTCLHGDLKGWAFSTVFEVRLHSENTRIVRKRMKKRAVQQKARRQSCSTSCIVKGLRISVCPTNKIENGEGYYDGKGIFVNEPEVLADGAGATAVAMVGIDSEG
jgi:hypothetical protein